MIEFRPYRPEFAAVAFEIFDSNTPLFVHPDEREDLRKFLSDEVQDLTYYIMFYNGRGVGMCGFHFESSKNEGVLVWGLLHSEFHGRRLGEAMLQFRIGQLRKLSPGVRIVCRTSQHTEGFFARYGFNTVRTVKDYWAQDLHLKEMELLPQ